MAAVQQRKLVHKQFNSPIGIYSEDSVKETLDREMKALSCGAIGIDFTQPRKPANLANSAVLRMLEEQENEKQQANKRKKIISNNNNNNQNINERMSRSRCRTIDRETVLKINRRARKRDISWPPIPSESDKLLEGSKSSDIGSRSRSSSNEIRFDENIRKRPEIFHLKEMFDKGTIYESKKKYIQNSNHTESNNYKSGNCNTIKNNEDSTFTDSQGSNYYENKRHIHVRDWSPTLYSENNETIANKIFVLPKDEIHFRRIDEIRKYFDKSIQQKNDSGRNNIDAYRKCPVHSVSSLRKWKSHENIIVPSKEEIPQSQNEKNKHFNKGHGSCCMERYKSSSYNELPPLKPRRDHRKNLPFTSKKTLISNNSNNFAEKDQTPKGYILSDEKSSNICKILSRDENEGSELKKLHNEKYILSPNSIMTSICLTSAVKSSTLEAGDTTSTENDNGIQNICICNRNKYKVVSADNNNLTDAINGTKKKLNYNNSSQDTKTNESINIGSMKQCTKLHDETEGTIRNDKNIAIKRNNTIKCGHNFKSEIIPYMAGESLINVNTAFINNNEKYDHRHDKNSTIEKNAILDINGNGILTGSHTDRRCQNNNIIDDKEKQEEILIKPEIMRESAIKHDDRKISERDFNNKLVDYSDNNNNLKTNEEECHHHDKNNVGVQKITSFSNNVFKSNQISDLDTSTLAKDKREPFSFSQYCPKYGMGFTDGEYIWRSYDNEKFDKSSKTKQNTKLACDKNNESKIQILQSPINTNITNHKRKQALINDYKTIDLYMRAAERTLFDAELCLTKDTNTIGNVPFENRNPVGIINECPSSVLLPIGNYSFHDQSVSYLIPENVPVVDNALIDLYNFSKVLSALGWNKQDDKQNENSAQITEIYDNHDQLSLSTISPPLVYESESTSRTESSPILDEIVHSKNILSAYLISKQNQDEIFHNISVTSTDDFNNFHNMQKGNVNGNYDDINKHRTKSQMAVNSLTKFQNDKRQNNDVIIPEHDDLQTILKTKLDPNSEQNLNPKVNLVTTKSVPKVSKSTHRESSSDSRSSYNHHDCQIIKATDDKINTDDELIETVDSTVLNENTKPDKQMVHLGRVGQTEEQHKPRHDHNDEMCLCDSSNLRRTINSKNEQQQCFCHHKNQYQQQKSLHQHRNGQLVNCKTIENLPRNTSICTNTMQPGETLNYGIKDANTVNMSKIAATTWRFSEAMNTSTCCTCTFANASSEQQKRHGDNSKLVQMTSSKDSKADKLYDKNEKLSPVCHSSVSNYPLAESNYADILSYSDNISNAIRMIEANNVVQFDQDNVTLALEPGRTRGRILQRSNAFAANDRVRSISQPPSTTASPLYLQQPCGQMSFARTMSEEEITEPNKNSTNSSKQGHPYRLIRQHSLDSSESRYYDAPRLYLPGQFHSAKGYKRVAWPPASDGTSIKASTPQPGIQQPNQQYPQQQGGHHNPSQPTQPQYPQHLDGHVPQPQSYPGQNIQQQGSPQGGQRFFQPNSPSSLYQQPAKSGPVQQPPSPHHYPAPTQTSFQKGPSPSTVSFSGGIAQQQYPPPSQTNQPYKSQQYSPQAVPSHPPYQYPTTQPQQYQQSHPQQSQPQQFHPQQSHPHQPNLQQSHPQQSHPQQSHPQQSHPQQSHPQQSHPQQSHPQQSHPQQYNQSQHQQSQYQHQYQQQHQYSYQQQDHHQQQQQPQQQHLSINTQYPISPPVDSPSSPRGWSQVKSPARTFTGYTQPAQYPPSSFGTEREFGSHQQQKQYQPQAAKAFREPVSQTPVRVSHEQSSHPQQYYQRHHQQYNQFQHYSQASEAQEQSHQGQQGQYVQHPTDRGLSPGIITLRKEAPISQKPAPIYTSEPAAASFKGGSNMRGDMKWPPAEYKAQAVAENEARRKLAMEPAVRPRRVNKDYSGFFAKHALNSTYPGYKVPPGTQHVGVPY